jgi:hypothetical protein
MYLVNKYYFTFQDIFLYHLPMKKEELLLPASAHIGPESARIQCQSLSLSESSERLSDYLIITPGSCSCSRQYVWTLVVCGTKDSVIPYGGTK